MASGDLLFELNAQNVSGPGTNYATHDFIQDGSTPPIKILVLDFDGAADEHADWHVPIPSQYSGGTGFTFSYKYATDGADADLVELEFRVLHIDDLDVLTADLGIDTQTPVAIQDTPPATPTDKFSYSTTGALAKADFGEAAAGDRIVIRCTRDISAATNTDDLQLVEIYVTET
jgi:hypothetical protein